MATNTSDTDDDSWVHQDTFRRRHNANRNQNSWPARVPAAVDKSSSSAAAVTETNVTGRTTRPSGCNNSTLPVPESDVEEGSSSEQAPAPFLSDSGKTPVGHVFDMAAQASLHTEAESFSPPAEKTPMPFLVIDLRDDDDEYYMNTVQVSESHKDLILTPQSKPKVKQHSERVSPSSDRVEAVASQSCSDMSKKRSKRITASDEIRRTSAYSSQGNPSSKRSRSSPKKPKRRTSLCAFPNERDLKPEVTPRQGSRYRPESFRRISTGPSAKSKCFHERLTDDDNIDEKEPMVGCGEWRKVRPTRFNKQHIELLQEFILYGSLRQPGRPWRQVNIHKVLTNGELDITDGYSKDQENHECVSSHHVYVFHPRLERKCVMCAVLKENDEERKALICDGCNYCVHPECAGVRIPIAENEPFFCQVCLEEQADNQQASHTCSVASILSSMSNCT